MTLESTGDGESTKVTEGRRSPGVSWESSRGLRGTCGRIRGKVEVVEYSRGTGRTSTRAQRFEGDGLCGGK